MSKNKEANLFQKIVDAIEKASEELQDTNTYLYAIGVELADANNVLRDIATSLDKLSSQPLKVTVDFATFMQNIENQTPKPEEAEQPTFAFEKLKKKVTK